MRKHRIHILIITAIAFAIAAVISAPCAYADDEAFAKLERIEELSNQVQESQTQIDEMESQKSALSDEILIRQSEQAVLSEELGQIAKAMYKGDFRALASRFLLDAKDLRDIIDALSYLEHYSANVAAKVQEKKDCAAKLQSEYDAMSAKQDELNQLIAQSEEDRKQLAIEVAEASGLSSDMDEEEMLEQAKILLSLDTSQASEWREGVASAYGGHSDASVADNQRTATGAPVNEYSMGVAVPMAWPNFRSYFGHQVEIVYGGKTVIATVNDCGGMGGGSRHLDLQPGVFKAFGFEDCYAWGLRTVKYRFL